MLIIHSDTKECKRHGFKVQKYQNLVFLFYISGLINNYKLKKYSAMEKINSELVTSEEPPTKKLCIDNKECSEIKIRKRHVALLLAYCGTNYYGMQKNTSFRTVESELLQALYKANLIPFEAINDLHLIHFQRAARTDKGVSAVRQVVSLKLGL